MILCKEKEIEQLPDDLVELRQIRERELLQLHHLERSNRELLEALADEDDQDPELQKAVEENRLTIDAKLARVREIDVWIQKITTSRASLACETKESLAALQAPTSEFPVGLDL
eukprot:TRINITY_DN26360_c0_g1_i1.p3 TRINITY_DN26360_c0_g1~~TRINITY_DN26360_c0_g1_i1.p3  ORF type:complete len:114 (-),score=33.55 TRINITY_DN26360_c0_g1_i1:393-734(-)